MRNTIGPRRGFALLLVLTVLAVTAILGMGLLAGNSLQAQAAKSSTQNGLADGLAESGVNLALYYLQNPAKAPSLNSDGYWPGSTNISLGSAVNGKIDVAVVRDTTNTSLYNITSTGKYGSGTTYPITRTMTAQLQMATQIPAMGIGGSLTLQSNVYVKGNVQSNGTVLVYGHVDGTVSGSLVWAATGTVWDTITLGTNQLPTFPTLTTVNTYSTYKYNGVTYAAQSLPSGSVVNPDPVHNPAGVFYCGNKTLNGVTINGTLVVTGTLTVNGPLTINAQSGFPALIVKGTTKIKTANGGDAALVANGITWLGGALQASNSSRKSGSAQFNGSLIMSGGSIDIDIPTVQIYYHPELANVTNLDTTQAASGRAYKLRSWQ